MSDKLKEQVDLFEKIRNDKTPDAVPLWSVKERRIVLGSDLSIRVSKEIQLSSKRLIEIVGQPEGDLVVPLDGRVGVQPSISIDSLARSRASTTVDSSVMQALFETYAGGSSPDGRPDALLLRRDELLTYPLVRLSSQGVGVPAVGGRFSLRQFLPVSSFKASFRDELYSDLFIECPPEAVTEIAVAICRLDLLSCSIRAASLAERYAGVPSGTESPEFLRGHLSGLTAQVVVDIQTLVRSVQASGDGIRNSWIEKSWSDGLTSTEKIFHDRNHAISTATINTYDDVVTICNDLIKLVKETRCFFALPHVVDDSTNLCSHPTLSKSLSSLTCEVRLIHVSVPFSTEREPSTQGKRSAVLLFLLGLVLAILSWIDTSWMPSYSAAPSWIPRLAAPGPISKDALDTLKEPFSSLLVFLPALIYGQFFQTRPRTDLGNQAQLGLFALLSLLFGLPIIPAALIVVGASPVLISKMLVTMSFFCIFASLAVGRLFRSGTLSELRVDEAKHTTNQVLSGLNGQTAAS